MMAHTRMDDTNKDKRQKHKGDNLIQESCDRFKNNHTLQGAFCLSLLDHKFLDKRKNRDQDRLVSPAILILGSILKLLLLSLSH